ncbi:hypothetical protein MAR_003308 [Mya arenaria]|uniref:Uncharacterized protein n=1 Tax=Mya arenaria TaxID=6604 RepID=A0ABY7G5N5_MYAAR|nr:hypothetical protein MAR_003308 [Mya arenaria]
MSVRSTIDKHIGRCVVTLMALIGPSFICKKGECKLCGSSRKTDTGPGSRSICSRKNPIPNVEEICIIPKDVDIAKLHSCLDVSIKINETTYRESIGCFTIPKKNFLDRIACVIAKALHNGMEVKFKDKTYNDAWGCFKIPNKADDLQTFETLDSEDIDAVTDSFGSDDGDDDSDTIELDEISMFGGENNDPSTRLQRAMLTFLKSLQQQTVL